MSYLGEPSSASHGLHDLVPHSHTLSLHFCCRRGSWSTRQLPWPTSAHLAHSLLLCLPFPHQLREGPMLGPTCLPYLSGKEHQDGRVTSWALPSLRSPSPSTVFLALRLHLGFVQNENVRAASPRAHCPEEAAAYSLVPHCLDIKQLVIVPPGACVF